MEFLEKLLSKKDNLTKSSKVQYISMLKTLNNGKTPKSLKYLKSVKKISDILKDKSENTRKSYYACLVSMLKLNDDPEYEKALKIYTKNMNDLNKKSNMFEDKNEITEKQKENWLTLSEVEKVYNELEKQVKKIKPEDNTKKSYKTLLDFTILSLYLLNPPRRNKDYTQMNLILKDNNDLPKTFNYYNPKTSEFIFNTYKTSKKYGQQIIKVPKKLKNILDNLISKNPMNKKDSEYLTVPLFMQSNKKRITSDYITKSLNRIFDKKISSSMLRHIILSEKFGDLLKQQKKFASEMAHGLNMQKAYIKYNNKVDNNKIIEV